jgi:hypothetical protein
VIEQIKQKKNSSLLPHRTIKFILKNLLAFFNKNFAGITSSMNSSTTTTNSESNLLSDSIVKVKSNSSNKENKLQRFGGAVVNGGTLVFGKIKSLWSVNGSGLNTLADRKNNSKSKENLGLYTFCSFRA